MQNYADPVNVIDATLVSAATATTSAGGSDQGASRQQPDHAEKAARYRLVIEEGPVQGTFVYKTLDSATGEVVRQFPREQVLRMAESGTYTAGGLIDTSA